jgi:hypothetical protein
LGARSVLEQQNSESETRPSPRISDFQLVSHFMDKRFSVMIERKRVKFLLCFAILCLCFVYLDWSREKGHRSAIGLDPFTLPWPFPSAYVNIFPPNNYIASRSCHSISPKSLCVSDTFADSIFRSCGGETERQKFKLDSFLRLRVFLVSMEKVARSVKWEKRKTFGGN